MTPFFNSLWVHMAEMPFDTNAAFHHMVHQLTEPPIHMQATAIAESK